MIDMKGVVMSAIHTLFEDEIKLLHRRLRYPSILVMKKLFPDQINSQLNNLKCEVCEFVKYKKTSYLSSNTMTIDPFRTIYCDLWGPINVKRLE